MEKLPSQIMLVTMPEGKENSAGSPWQLNGPAGICCQIIGEK
jgi:hypothetical protein